MLTLIILTTLSLLLAMIFFMASLLTSEKTTEKMEKNTPFECGFSPFKKARSPFSLRFFLITLIFLIFDIEIALLLPLSITVKSSDILITTATAWVVLVILIGGLLHEWNQGALEWID